MTSVKMLARHAELEEGQMHAKSAVQRSRIRLLIADDHALILEGLAATIGRQKDMTVVATASDGREAVELWLAHRPDIALLDLHMPKLIGVLNVSAFPKRLTFLQHGAAT